jgi:hypothetical protein
MDGWMDGWMDEWMNGRTRVCLTHMKRQTDS